MMVSLIHEQKLRKGTTFGRGNALVRDAAWILTKNSVMGKVVGMMADLVRC
jgi:hypothetical protein